MEWRIRVVGTALLLMLLSAAMAQGAQVPNLTPPLLWPTQGQEKYHHSGWLWEPAGWSQVEVGVMMWDQKAVAKTLREYGWTDIAMTAEDGPGMIRLTELSPSLSCQFTLPFNIASPLTVCPSLTITARQGRWQARMWLVAVKEVLPRELEDLLSADDSGEAEYDCSYLALLSGGGKDSERSVLPPASEWRSVPGSRLVRAYFPTTDVGYEGNYCFETPCSPQVIIDHYPGEIPDFHELFAGHVSSVNCHTTGKSYTVSVSHRRFTDGPTRYYVVSWDESSTVGWW